MEKSHSVHLNKGFGLLPNGPQNEFKLQSQIRPFFGKNGINSIPIGTHPDFIDLEGDDSRTVRHYICSFFVDIKGSTRLSLLYPLEKVHQFKNAVLQTCIEVIRSLDGHVHRLMGDAVMAYFGGNGSEKEDAIVDAINCSVTLRSLLEGSIKPWMEQNGMESKDFGFRVGCDFGNQEDVLWGKFGYSNVGEVTATGLSVDMASKLQSLASKNRTMLGQGLLKFIDWPDKYSKTKNIVRSGETTPQPFVTPNLIDKNGQPINYTMRLLDFDSCLQFSALPQSFRASVSNSCVVANPHIQFECHTICDEIEQKYLSATRFLEKEVSLRFGVVVATNGNRLAFPLTVYLTKKNNGKEAKNCQQDHEYVSCEKVLQKRRTSLYDRSPQPFVRISHNECTQYRGLHTMKCEVFDKNKKLVFRDWIGVMIK